MLIRSRTLTGLLFITLAGTSAAGAAPLASSTHQTEQDKARQEALAPQQQVFSLHNSAWRRRVSLFLRKRIAN